jgi:hypothetical protein
MRFSPALLALLVPYAVFVAGGSARGDIVIYDVPSLPIQVTLQGKVIVNSGETVTFRHRLGTLHFALGDTKRYEVDQTTVIGRRMLVKARSSKDALQAMEASDWLLNHGMLTEFYAAIDYALEFDPQNKDAQRIKVLQQKMEKWLTEDPGREEILRSQVRNPEFRIRRSNHFILYHDTPEKRAKGRKQNRAGERLDLLEEVYEVFLLKFSSRGFEIEIPEKLLMVLLFDEHQAFLDYARNIHESLINADGFWSPTTNIGVFYDHGTAAHYEGLRDLAKELKNKADEARRARERAGDLIRTAKTIDLLVRIAQENSDITVVSHEATHQMAGNTGLFPRDVNIPRWVHEGLAAYFEAPNDSVWAGIGAVNKDRIGWYRALAEDDTEHSSLDFIVGDQIFDYAKSQGQVLHAYGQAWALTHFLVERHFDELMIYYRRLGEFPPDTPISADVLNELFDQVFGAERKKLEREWRDYMRDLKTDMEILVGEEEED